MFLLMPTLGTFSRDPDLKWKLKCLFRLRPGAFSSVQVSGLQRWRNHNISNRHAPGSELLGPVALSSLLLELSVARPPPGSKGLIGYRWFVFPTFPPTSYQCPGVSGRTVHPRTVHEPQFVIQEFLSWALWISLRGSDIGYRQSTDHLQLCANCDFHVHVNFYGKESLDSSDSTRSLWPQTHARKFQTATVH